MKSNKANRNSEWTTEQLLNLSRSWAYVFPVEVDRAKTNDAWTSEQFIRVGNRFICL